MLPYWRLPGGIYHSTCRLFDLYHGSEVIEMGILMLLLRSLRSLLLSCWRAQTLYVEDINILIEELSMSLCNDEMSAIKWLKREPYRAVLREVRSKLKNTVENIENQLNQKKPTNQEIINTKQELWDQFLLAINHFVTAI